MMRQKLVRCLLGEFQKNSIFKVKKSRHRPQPLQSWLFVWACVQTKISYLCLPPLCHRYFEHAKLCETIADRKLQLRQFSSDDKHAWKHESYLAALFFRFQHEALNGAIFYCRRLFCLLHSGTQFPADRLTDDHCRLVMVKIARLMIRKTGKKGTRSESIWFMGSVVECSVIYIFKIAKMWKENDASA